MSRMCSWRGSVDGHAEHLVVAAGLVGHPEHADRAALDQAAGERRGLQQHQRVERVAVEAEGVLDVAVVGGVLRRGEEHPVQAHPAGLVVDLVLVALALGDLDEYVELQHVLPPVVCDVCGRVRRRAGPSRGVRLVSRTMSVIRARRVTESTRSTGWPATTGVPRAPSSWCSSSRWSAGGAAVWRYDLLDRLRGDDDPPPAPDPSRPRSPRRPASRCPRWSRPAGRRRGVGAGDRRARRRPPCAGPCSATCATSALGRHVLAEVAPLDGRPRRTPAASAPTTPRSRPRRPRSSPAPPRCSRWGPTTSSPPRCAAAAAC